MKKYLIFIGLIVISNLAFTQNRVFNFDSSISFIPIHDWVDASDGEEMIFVQPLQSTIDIFNDRITLVKYPNEGLSLDEYWAKYVTNDFKYQFDDFFALRSFESKVNQKQARGMIFTNKLEGVTLKNKFYFVNHKGYIYTFSLITTERDFSLTEHLFESMVNTVIIH
ncbi:MAG: hypothetical protein WC984_06270 [Bacteroidales bacterium]